MKTAKRGTWVRAAIIEFLAFAALIAIWRSASTWPFASSPTAAATASREAVGVRRSNASSSTPAAAGQIDRRLLAASVRSPRTLGRIDPAHAESPSSLLAPAPDERAAYAGPQLERHAIALQRRVAGWLLPQRDADDVDNDLANAEDEADEAVQPRTRSAPQPAMLPR